jgi:hypothetical protein
VIRAYPRWPSVRPGETLTLHVSTDRPRFRVEFYRQGATLERVAGAPAGWLPGHHFPDGPPDRDWGWPGYDFRVPAGWPSGAYVALLVEQDAGGREHAPDRSTADGADARALFVVRSPRPGRDTSILYKLSWATYHVYDGTGYGSLYAESVWSRDDRPPGFKLTWRRPGGGTGGVVEPGDPPDAYQPEVRRQTFAKWDVPLIAWLEREGYRVDYCTDLDLHRDPDLLAPYALLLSVGHDEYWSDAMRARLDGFVGAGGHLAFLSGNIAGFRIHFTDGDTAITCAKVPPGPGAPRPWALDTWQEEATTGVSLRHGGGWWDGRREPLGYTVQHADHWVYAGTGLREGDVFGADPGYPLVGYEADGAAFVRRDGRAVPTGEGGTPASFVILGVAELGEGWVRSSPRAAATMGLYTTPGGGVVFQAATTDWPIVVPRDPRVARVTRNVLDRLRLRGAPVVGPLPHQGGRMVAVEGQPATFHVDAAGLGPLAALGFAWDVAGGEAARRDGPVLAVRPASPPRPLTVSITVSRDGRPVAFGTATTLPLSHVERDKLRALVLLREMTLPGQPANSLAHPTADPLGRTWLLYSLRLPWIRERAEELEQVLGRLDGPPTPSPERP